MQAFKLKQVKSYRKHWIFDVHKNVASNNKNDLGDVCGFLRIPFAALPFPSTGSWQQRLVHSGNLANCTRVGRATKWRTCGKWYTKPSGVKSFGCLLTQHGMLWKTQTPPYTNLNSLIWSVQSTCASQFAPSEWCLKGNPVALQDCPALQRLDNSKRI